MIQKLLKPLSALLIAVGCGWSVGAVATSQPSDPNVPVNPFRKNVTVQVTDDFLIVHSNGIPDHPTGPFPNRYNPNTIREQNYTFRIPRHPVWSDKITRTPMGPIGVAINGIPFYNPYNAQGRDAAKNEVFDECCGHPDPAGRYHYHIYPRCIHTSFKDEPGKHSELIGYAFDGYAIYGPNGEGGKPPTDLDECNGHWDPVRGYHYHVTSKFPYIIGGYHGVVEKSNFDGRQMAMAMMDGLGGPGQADADHAGGEAGGGGGAGPGGPGDGNEPAGANGPGRGGPPQAGYHLLPRFAMEGLDLTDEQRAKLHDLEAQVKEKLKTILTADQYKQLEQMTPPPPPRRQGGGRGPQGGGGGGQQGGGGGGPQNNGGPPGNGRPSDGQ